MALVGQRFTKVSIRDLKTESVRFWKKEFVNNFVNTTIQGRSGIIAYYSRRFPHLRFESLSSCARPYPAVRALFQPRSASKRFQHAVSTDRRCPRLNWIEHSVRRFRYCGSSLYFSTNFASSVASLRGKIPG